MIATNKEAINNNSNKNRIRKKINAGNERLRNVNTQFFFRLSIQDLPELVLLIANHQLLYLCTTEHDLCLLGLVILISRLCVESYRWTYAADCVKIVSLIYGYPS